MSQTAQTPLTRQAGWLAAALALVGLAALAVAYLAQGPTGFVPVLVAWTITAFSAFAALAPACLAARIQPPRSDALLLSVLGGMLVRMAVPLAAILVVKFQFPAMFNLAWLGYLVVFYLTALAVETWLALPNLTANRSVSRTLNLTPPASEAELRATHG